MLVKSEKCQFWVWRFALLHNWHFCHFDEHFRKTGTLHKHSIPMCIFYCCSKGQKNLKETHRQREEKQRTSKFDRRISIFA